ncbi:tRNA (uracil-5-)-methyltransferase, partial [Haematococcus lacustris]
MVPFPSTIGLTTTRPVLGLLRPGTSDQVLAVGACLLQPPQATLILASVRQEVAALGLLPANDPGGQGLLVSLVLRSA